MSTGSGQFCEAFLQARAEAEAEFQALADNMPTLGFVVDACGRIAALNAVARALLRRMDAAEHSLDESDIGALDIEPVAARRIIDWIRGRAAGASAPYFMMPRQVGADDAQSCLIASPIIGACVEASAEQSRLQGPFFLVASLDLNLDREVTDAFVAAFELSGAEGEIASALAHGERSADIAARRGASVNTASSQIKSATRKAGGGRGGRLGADVQRLRREFQRSARRWPERRASA